MPDKDRNKPEPPDEAFEVGEDDVDQEAEATKEVSEALGQFSPDEVDIGDGAREPAEALAQDDFDRIEPGPTELVSFGAEPEPAEGAEEPPPRRRHGLTILVAVLANILVLGGIGFILWQKHKANLEEQRHAEPLRRAESGGMPVLERISSKDSPEREVEDAIRTRPMTCDLTGLQRDRADLSHVTIHLLREHAFDLAELNQEIDRDAAYVLKGVFDSVPSIQKVTIICRSRIKVDQNGLNPQIDDAFRVEVTRDRHAKAKYGDLDSLQKLSAYYHPRLAALKAPEKPRPQDEP